MDNQQLNEDPDNEGVYDCKLNSTVVEDVRIFAILSEPVVNLILFITLHLKQYQCHPDPLKYRVPLKKCSNAIFCV